MTVDPDLAIFTAIVFLILLAVLWTVFSTREYSPEEIAEFEAGDEEAEAYVEPEPHPASRYRNGGFAWIIAGAALAGEISLASAIARLIEPPYLTVPT